MAGLTFGVPTATDPQEQRRTLDALGPAQRAIQVLSLSLPKFLNTSQAIAPRSLLVGQPAVPGQPTSAPTTPESAVLQSLLRTLMPQAVDSGTGMGVGPGGPSVGPTSMTGTPGSVTGAMSSDDILKRILALVNRPAPPTFTPGDTGGPPGPSVPIPDGSVGGNIWGPGGPPQGPKTPNQPPPDQVPPNLIPTPSNPTTMPGPIATKGGGGLSGLGTLLRLLSQHSGG